MEYILVLTPDDKVLFEPYNGYESISNAVNGFIERFSRIKLSESYTISFFCNDEFAITDSDEFLKANALAMGITSYNGVIRGNVAVLIDLGENFKGFTEFERVWFTSLLKQAVRPSYVDFIHKIYDKEKI